MLCFTLAEVIGVLEDEVTDVVDVAVVNADDVLEGFIVDDDALEGFVDDDTLVGFDDDDALAGFVVVVTIAAGISDDDTRFRPIKRPQWSAS